MARMSIDDKIGRDPRITELARVLGWSRRETVGCLVSEVWPVCYDQESAVVSERMIDTAAAHVGFAKAMLECELASRDRSGKLRVMGARERIEYLNHKRRAGKQGGVNSAVSRGKYTKQQSPAAQAVGNPSVPDPDPVSVPVPDPDPDPDPKEESGSPAGLALVPSGPSPKPLKRKPADSPHHQATIDAFHQRYKAKYGLKPDWGGKEIGMLSALLKRHDLDAMVERMDFMFSGKAKWPPGPYSLDVFVRHFDRWVDERPAQAPIRRLEEL